MLVEGKNLFPLCQLLGIRRNTYFMSAAHDVYSVARGKLVRLFGSQPTVGRRHSYSFQGVNGRQMVVERGALIRAATSHSTFKEHTAPNTLGANMNKTQKSTKTSHAPTVDAGVKAKGSIIGRVHKGHLVFGSAPAIHTTADSVKTEMERLARQYPGVKFVECKLAQSVVAGGINWE